MGTPETGSTGFGSTGDAQDPSILAIAEADRQRNQNPKAALRTYAGANPASIVEDADRLLWITQQFSEVPPPELQPLLNLATTDADGLAQRRALHLMALANWFGGDLAEAESLWRRGFELGRESEDDIWFACLQNLTLVFTVGGRFFEGLVLLGQACRVARRIGDPYGIAYAHVRRAAALHQLDDLAGAAHELRLVDRIYPQIEDPIKGHKIAASSLAVKCYIFKHRKQWREAHAAVLEQISHLEVLPASTKASLIGCHSARLGIECELAPERATELIAELDGLGARLGLGEAWEPMLRTNSEQLKLRRALINGDRAEALRAGRALLDLYRTRSRDDELIQRTRSLGRSFTEIGAIDEARVAYDLAATTALRRIVQIDQVTRDIPELSDATSEDWAILNAHRHKLVARRSRLYDAIVALWKPGNAAFDLVVGDADFLRVCAWCKRVRTASGAWIPVTQFFPEAADFQATHGICDHCRDQALQ